MTSGRDPLLLLLSISPSLLAITAVSPSGGEKKGILQQSASKHAAHDITETKLVEQAAH